MKKMEIRPEAGFGVVAGTQSSQAATMVLEPGESTGGPDNRHDESDQWLYVLSGSGRGVIEGATQPLEAGTLLLIEAGEAHEIRNTGEVPLETLNFYAPPVY